MKITGIETFVVSNGFTPPRPWHFCAIRTDAGLTGYSEFGSDGITHGLVGLVQDLGHRLIGKDPTAVEKHYLDLYRAVRQAPYGATQQAIAGIELALWDLAGKALGVPVYKLMGGPHRERQWVYWSHLATYRASNWKLFGVKPLRSLTDLADAAREAPARGYTAFKTNIIWPGDPARNITQGRLGPHDQVASRDIVEAGRRTDQRDARGRRPRRRHLSRHQRELQAERGDPRGPGARAVRSLLARDRQPGPPRAGAAQVVGARADLLGRAAPDHPSVPAVLRAARDGRGEGRRPVAGLLGGEEGGRPRRDVRAQHRAPQLQRPPQHVPELEPLRLGLERADHGERPGADAVSRRAVHGAARDRRPAT